MHNMYIKYRNIYFCLQWIFHYCRDELLQKEHQLKRQQLEGAAPSQAPRIGLTGGAAVGGAILGAGRIAQLEAELKQTKVRNYCWKLFPVSMSRSSFSAFFCDQDLTCYPWDMQVFLLG